MKNLKENKAITLIALVITIIVLLLLAGISISMISGQDGIINKAAQAKQLNKEKEQEDMLNMDLLQSEIDFNTQGYEKNGLILQYDGIYNSGVGNHNDSANIWKDLSGNGHDGELKGNPIWEKNALSFDGTNDFVDCGSINLDYSTMEIVVEFNNIVEGKSTDFFGNFQGAGGGLTITPQGNSIAIAEFSVGGSYKYCILNEIPYEIGSKYYVSVTYDGNIIKAYINGNLKSTIEINGKIDPSEARMAIGANPSPSTGTGIETDERIVPLNGKVYSARIYDRALTENEIKKNYELDSERFGIK